MVLGAVRFSPFTINCSALVTSEIQWMVFELFPAVAHLAMQPVRARILIVHNFRIGVPERALLIFVLIEVWLPPIVLPVVRKNALDTIVVFVRVRAPFCFEVERIEVSVPVKLIQQINRNFRVVVCIGTIFPILAHVLARHVCHVVCRGSHANTCACRYSPKIVGPVFLLAQG